MGNNLMSCIILYHTTTPIPQHLIDCVEKIRQLSNIDIHLLTDKDISPNVKNIYVKNIKNYDSLNWLNELDYFNNDLSYGYLWKSSCFRMFYIKKYIEDLNLQNILHFDNDVLLFEVPEKIIELMTKYINKYAITAHNQDEVVMGMSFIKNVESMLPLLDFIQRELYRGFAYLHSTYNGYPNEMQLISRSNIYDNLPILPGFISSERYSKYFQEFNSVFDPSSYGQYLGGTFSEKKPGWFGRHQEIGKHLSEDKIKVIMEDKNPYLVCQDQKIKINNLHIHSKQTGIFL